jgi:hypothetical protein
MLLLDRRDLKEKGICEKNDLYKKEELAILTEEKDIKTEL